MTTNIIINEPAKNFEEIKKLNEEGVELEKRMGEFYIYKINNL